MPPQSGTIFQVGSTGVQRCISTEILAANPVHVPRVLDVVKSKLCWILGTIYIEMPLKPNVLEDLGRDVGAPNLRTQIII